MSAESHLENEDPMWKIHMRTLMKRKRNLQIAQTIDEVLHQYYVVERGIPVPQWKSNKNPQWWIDYLESLCQET
ncbi:hypothetical protein PTIM40_118 [Cyanophage P-TIM40]|uniref:Uncharacterized protein n=1 Tax=Cyanophage P-TIM40 TaxID=1589733 RepID=A0A0C5AMW8_9CAUD|nr:hypothetical protein AU107_gp118 [Cyanophage P-TIM40]AJK27545.1 hypothetical protein PTIM40_118 [Cyanophage P-TIM40]